MDQHHQRWLTRLTFMFWDKKCANNESKAKGNGNCVCSATAAN